MQIVHSDAEIIVVDKPSGLLSVPGRGADKQDCASARVQAGFPDALIVHRLDMSTSGLLLFARGPAAQRELSHEFAERRVDKRYIAVLDGEVDADLGAWRDVDLPLICDWPNRPRQIVDHAIGKPSRTRWRVLAREHGRTRVELEPLTGRTHQLRVHMQALGHPICGDALYGPQAPAAPTAPRLLLHASRLHLQARDLTFESTPEF